MNPVAGALEVRESQDRARRIRGPVLAAGAVLALSVALHLRDPHQGGSWGFCPWLVLTGTSCPGCGGLRAVNHLTHGELAAAASSNLLFVLSVPALAIVWVRWLADRWNGVRRRTDVRRGTVYAVAFSVVALVFWVVRNLEFAAWLQP